MTQTWKRYRADGTIGEATLEPWRWEAHYNDGTILRQFGEDGMYHQFGDIEIEKLHVFGMVHDTLPPMFFFMNENLKPIHFYKVFGIEVGGENERHYKFYGFGYQDLKTGNKTILIIRPDNSIIPCNDADELIVTMDKEGML